MNCNSENITSRYFIKIFIEFQNQKQILIPFVGYRTFLFKFYRKELLVFKNISLSSLLNNLKPIAGSTLLLVY